MDCRKTRGGCQVWAGAATFEASLPMNGVIYYFITESRCQYTELAFARRPIRGNDCQSPQAAAVI
jgi:hypothetical protein